MISQQHHCHGPVQVKDQARRFITLVDELYNNRVRLICTAACPPDVLFTGAESHEEAILDLEGLQFETAVEGAFVICMCAMPPKQALHKGHLPLR